MRNKFIKKTLKNGIKLYLYIDKSMKKTLVDYIIDYGSHGKYFDFYLNNQKYHVLPGCAHFLEHMLGEHSKYGNMYTNFSKRKYQRNAITSMKNTYYYFIGKNDIYTSIKELITAIECPVFTEQDIKETRKAIIEETKRGKDDKYRIAQSIVDRNLYSDIEVVTDTLCSIGDETTTKELTYDMLMACYNAFYNDNNKKLLIAGNINEKEITKYLEKIYKEIPKHENKCKLENHSLDKIRKKEQIEYMATEDEYTLFAFRNKINEEFTTKEIVYFTDFLLQHKFNSSTEFIKNLKKDNIISKLEVTNLSLDFNELCIYIGASCKNYKKFIQALKKELLTNNFTPKDFKLYVRKTIADQAFRIDYRYNNLLNFVFRLYYTDDFDDIDVLKKLTFKKFLKFYNSLTLDKNTTAIIKKNK